MLERFLHEVVGIEPTWTPAAVIDEQVARIRAQVGSEKVICGLSGGVDSAVAALLVYKAIGEQLTCVFVDHGFMRSGEAEQVVEAFRDHFHVPLVHVQAQDRFLARLEGIEEPEDKRHRIGEEFIRVFEDEAAKLGDVRFLVQGTLYSDVIESGGTAGVAAKIKSHHNVGGLPEEMAMELVEPLRLLFKDEVRRVGEELGMPERLVWRQPFPGPGLAIRIIGEGRPRGGSWPMPGGGRRPARPRQPGGIALLPREGLQPGRKAARARRRATALPGNRRVSLGRARARARDRPPRSSSRQSGCGGGESRLPGPAV
jgi:GMP synthase (glutamine-hydrolysing)